MERHALVILKKALDTISLVEIKLKSSNFVSNLPALDLEPASAYKRSCSAIFYLLIEKHWVRFPPVL